MTPAAGSDQAHDRVLRVLERQDRNVHGIQILERRDGERSFLVVAEWSRQLGGEWKETSK